MSAKIRDQEPELMERAAAILATEMKARDVSRTAARACLPIAFGMALHGGSDVYAWPPADPPVVAVARALARLARLEGLRMDCVVGLSAESVVRELLEA